MRLVGGNCAAVEKRFDDRTDFIHLGGITHMNIHLSTAEFRFIVGADGPDHALFTVLDNLIVEHKVPVMIAISIGNGGGDAQGSELGLEYDTMSGLYAEFVEQEVLPLVEKQCQVTLAKNPDGRATMGGSSGGSCALIMAWYHPELYHRVLTYSGTYVNQ
jgi:enterochelin esterase-like enzyme